MPEHDEAQTFRNPLTFLFGAVVTVLHVVLAWIILHAILCANKEDAFRIFAIISAIFISFCYFQRCVLHAMETLYNPVGMNYIEIYQRIMHFWKTHIVVGRSTLDQSITFQVILLGMTLIIIKICLFIVRDFCIGRV